MELPMLRQCCSKLLNAYDLRSYELSQGEALLLLPLSDKQIKYAAHLLISSMEVIQLYQKAGFPQL